MLDEVVLTFPALPDELVGFRIGHLSDLHMRQGRALSRRFLDAMKRLDCDLLVMTGDYMDHLGDEPAAIEALRQIIAANRTGRRIIAVFGNHDGGTFRHQAESLAIDWLHDESMRVDGLPLGIVGFAHDLYGEPDAVAVALRDVNDEVEAEASGLFRILLTHSPQWLATASDMGTDLMLSGHTHGGQIRLPGGMAPITSTDLPLGLSAGLLRHRDTLCAVSRGVGVTGLPWRLFCPPHVPVYHLDRGSLPGQFTDEYVNVKPW